jgi:hypothetical protein
MSGMLSTRPWQVSQPTPLLHVDAVIEVDEVREVVDADPLQRLVITEARADRLEVGAGRPDLRVAVDARLGGRDAGRRETSTEV